MPIRTVRFLLILAVAAVPAYAQPPSETALDRYIAQPDDAYRWNLERTLTGPGYTGWVLHLESQHWRSPEEVDRDVWTHRLTIVRPDAADADTAMLYIGGGDNDDPVPDRASDRLLELALGSGTVVAELGQVPNQPLHFADSPKQPRYEDDLIAYSRAKFIVTGDETWLARLPMVKSAVRAMDAVQEFMQSGDGGNVTINRFVVAGGSKRGWTTWLTPVVDDRVVAIIPLVIDALNTEAITRHHLEAYGFFSPSLGDYVRHGLYPYQLGTDTFDHILEIEDPYRYFLRDSMKLPKFIINASGDQYFLPDNSQFYFADMPQEKYLRYVENAKHNLAGSDARSSLLAFYLSIVHNTPRPQYSWTIDDAKTIHVTTPDTPIEVNLWQATNPDARDFRLDTIGKAWTKTPLTAVDTEAPPGHSNYLARVDSPEQGFTAFFVELVFDSGYDAPFKFTTDVQVVPDILPYTVDDYGKRQPLTSPHVPLARR